MAFSAASLLKAPSALEQLLEEINFQRTKEMRQLLKDDSGFVVLQGTTYWTDLFVRHFLFQDEQAIDCDDLLFFVRKKHVKGSSRYLPKYETSVDVFRKDSKKLPIGDPDIDWEETVYLNLIIHQFDYTLTLAICTRTSPKELQVLKRHSQKVTLRKGGRWPWLWLATIGHGIVVEAISYNLPDIDNFWHSQTPIIFLGYRFPLHILFLYSVFIYHASYAVSRLQLPGWAEPFAVGLVVILIDIPYDIVSVKFLHWTWHDTDPNIFDRHYWVPWNSYFFHAAFAASFTFWFHLTYNFCSKDGGKWQSRGFFKELRSTIITSLLAMPAGVIPFVLVYHPLHDFANIHSEVTFFVLATVFFAIAWSGDRTQRVKNTERPGVFDWILFLHLISHYATYMAFTIWGHPEKEVSMGLHEPIGPCNQLSSVKTPLGTILKKRKYLCPTDYNEEYFTFACLPEAKRPGNGAIWYTVCGTPFKNRNEYIVIIGTICFLAFAVFYNFYFRTYNSDSKAKGGKDSQKGKSKTQ